MNFNGIRIMLANKHQLFRSGIISLLNNNPEVYVVAEARTGVEVIEKYFALYPDIILSDFYLPVLTGMEAIKKIKEKDKSVKAVFITSDYSEENIYYCIKSGGSGLLNSNITIGEVLFAIKEIYNGGKYFGKIFSEDKFTEIIKKYEQLDKSDLFKGIERLSEREDEILILISEGITSIEIANKMNISKRTVDTYRSSIMQKFELKSLSELIKFAIRYSNHKNLTHEQNTYNPDIYA